MSRIMSQSTIAAVEWDEVFRIGKELFTLIQDVAVNITQIRAKVEELLNLFRRAEQISGQAIDWVALLKILIPLLLKLIGGMSGDSSVQRFDWGNLFKLLLPIIIELIGGIGGGTHNIVRGEADSPEVLSDFDAKVKDAVMRMNGGSTKLPLSPDEKA